MTAESNVRSLLVAPAIIRAVGNADRSTNVTSPSGSSRSTSGSMAASVEEIVDGTENDWEDDDGDEGDAEYSDEDENDEDYDSDSDSDDEDGNSAAGIIEAVADPQSEGAEEATSTQAGGNRRAAQRTMRRALTYRNISPNHTFCLFHLSQNCNRKFKRKELANLIIKIGTAATFSELQGYLREVKKKSEKCLKWLVKIPLIHWVYCVHQGALFGQRTNNVAESFNSLLREFKPVGPFSIIQQIVEKSTGYYTLENIEEQVVGAYTKFANDHIEKVKKQATGCLAKKVGNYHMVSEISKDGCSNVRYRVDLKAKTCSCGRFQCDQLPCVHAYVAITSISTVNKQVKLSDYMASCYLASNYKKMKSLTMVPTDTAELEITYEYLSPRFNKKPPGRPSEKSQRGLQAKKKKVT